MENDKKPIVITAKNNVPDLKLPDELNIKLESLRCINCNRFLLYYAVIEGTVATKCRRCGCWNILDAHGVTAIDKPPAQC